MRRGRSIRVNHRRIGAGLGALIVAVALSACANSTTSAGAQLTGSQSPKVTIRYAITLNSKTDLGNALRTFQRDIEHESHGKITVDLYYNGELGSNNAVETQVMNGTIQMFSAATSFLQQVDPSVTIDQLPYLFANYAQVTAFWNGKVGSEVKADILKKAGIRVLNVESPGFQELLTPNPITNVNAMNGLKIYTANTLQTKWATAFGMSGVTLPNPAAAYTALQQHLITSLTESFDTEIANQWYKLLKYASPQNEIFTSAIGQVNENFWQSLPKSYQTMIQAEMTKLQASELAQENRSQVSDEKQLKADGVTITPVTSALRNQLKSQVASIYSNVGSILGPEAATWLRQWDDSAK
jgi:TRAP-type C4-dicarboxylate transport system substrate-binding protein